jgi:branched-chain amino acid transport system ATP-binding protein
VFEVENLSTSYGPIRALWDVSLRVDDGEIVALIGANGAGKTTLLSTCLGLLRSDTGKVVFDGRDITRLPTHKIVQLGVCLVPEGRHVFPDLTVAENLRVATFGARDSETARSGRDMALDLFPRLAERSLQKAGTLSGGEQQMLAVARALVSRPRLLLLDEPSLGLAPVLVDQVFDCLREINKRGTSLLVVEQNAYLALDLSQRAYVMQNGRIVVEGPSSDLAKQDGIRASYLGGVVAVSVK